MAEYDNVAFEAMNNAVSGNENNTRLDWDKRMADENLDMGEFRQLYQKKYPDVSKGLFHPTQEQRKTYGERQEHFKSLESYWNPDTYRTLGDKEITERLEKAKTIKGDLMEFSEKLRFKKLTGKDPDMFQWDEDMYETRRKDDKILTESPFRRKGGFEDWMRDKGYYDETKTGGVVAAIQRFLPGGKKGMTRRFADPGKSDQKSGKY